jgi:hypothetical protein
MCYHTCPVCIYVAASEHTRARKAHMESSVLDEDALGPDRTESSGDCGLLRRFLAPVLTMHKVAFIAFQQWLSARNFEHQMRDSSESLNPGSRPAKDVEMDVAPQELGCPCAACIEVRVRTTPRVKTRRRFLWTRVHSHFTIMGGFAFDTSSMPVNI